MIVDKLENIDLYLNLSPKLKIGLDYIKNTNLSELPEGKVEITDGVFGIVSQYQTKANEDAKPEAHKEYIDIQVIISGAEKIGYAPLENQTASVEYDKEKDLVFYNTPVSHSILNSGMFAIYFPTDIHQPCVKIDDSVTVKKIVLKVPVK